MLTNLPVWRWWIGRSMALRWTPSILRRFPRRLRGGLRNGGGLNLPALKSPLCGVLPHWNVRAIIPRGGVTSSTPSLTRRLTCSPTVPRRNGERLCCLWSRALITVAMYWLVRNSPPDERSCSFRMRETSTIETQSRSATRQDDTWSALFLVIVPGSCLLRNFFTAGWRWALWSH